MRCRALGVVCVLAMLASGATPARAQTTTTEVLDPGPRPAKVIAGTGELKVAPNTPKIGEMVTASFAGGGVAWHINAPDGAKCSGKPTKLEGEAAKHLPLAYIGGASSCTWKAASTNGKWVAVEVSITGPCGDPENVRAGKAEYAICAGAHANDYYLAGSRSGISGRVRQSDGRPLVGVPVHLSGGSSETAVTTEGGNYTFFVSDGKYSVSGPSGFCTAATAAKKCEPVAKVSVPGSATVDFAPQTEGVIKGNIRDSQSKPVTGVTIRILGTSGQIVTTDGDGHYEARVPKGEYTLEASKPQAPTTDSAGKPLTPAPLKFCAARRSAGVGKCLDKPRVKVPPDQIVDFTPEGDAGLLVSISADEGFQGGFVRVKATITNPRSESIKYLKFEDDHGMSNEPVATGPAGSAASNVLALTDGPLPPPPSGLIAGASATMDYRFVAVDVGQAVLTVKATGTDGASGKTVTGEAAVTATVRDHDVNRDDMQTAVADGTDDILGTAADGLEQLNQSVAMDLKTTLNLPDASAADVTVGGQLGIPPDAAAIIKERPELAFELDKAEAEGFFGRAEKDTGEIKKWADGIYQTIADPDKRAAFGQGIIQEVKDLPSSTWNNAGYVGHALLSPLTEEGWQTAYDANAKAVANVGTFVDQTQANMAASRLAGVVKSREDPIGYAIDEKRALGDAEFGLIKFGVEAVTGDLEARAGVFVAGKALAPVLSGSRALLATATEVVKSRAELKRNMTLAAQAMRTIQPLEVGTILDAETLVGRGGWLASDAEAAQTKVLKPLEDKFGVPWQIAGRQSEISSAGIDVVAKKQFMTQKAVSPIAQMLGAEPTFAGTVGVTELAIVEAADARLQASGQLKLLAAKHPGFAEEYKAVLSAQKSQAEDWEKSAKWAEAKFGEPNYEKYEKSLRFLVDASKNPKYAKEGITVLTGVTGRPIPHGIRYLEQLDEAAFVESRGLTQSQVQALKKDLEHYPDAIKTLIGTETKNGTTRFIEELLNLPHGSDMDINYSGPVGGWGTIPMGQRGQAWSMFSSLMKTNVSRFPVHLGSDNAIDLSSKLYKKAVPYAIEHVPVSEARATATMISKRFEVMAKNAEDTAGRLNATADGREARAALTATSADRTRLQAEAASLRARAKEMTDNAVSWRSGTDPESLLKDRKLGQKTINITTGDIRVGHGSGGR